MRWRPYPSYSDSGVDLLGFIPSHWKVHKIKHLADVRLSNVDKLSVDGQTTVRLANYVDVYKNERITADMDLMVATASEDQIERLALAEEDVVITKDSETPDDIAVPAYVPEAIKEVVCGYHLALLRPQRGKLYGGFLHRWLQGKVSQAYFTSHANGMTRYGIGKGDIGDAPIVWVPMEEQKAIVTYLDRETARIDGLIAEQRTLIEHLCEKRVAVISHLVTKGLSCDVATKDSNIEWLGRIPSHWEVSRNAALFSERIEAGIEGLPILSISLHTGVSDGELSEGDDGRIKRRIEDRSAYARVYKGDLAYNMMRAWQGGLGAVPIDGLISPAYVVLRPNKGVISSFYEALFRTPCYVRDIERYSKGVTSFRWRLYWEDFKQLRSPVPPVEEQKAILVAIDHEMAKIDPLEREAETSIALLQEHRSALITAAVTGKIDVRETVHV